MKIAVSADWHIDNMKRTYLLNGLPNREIDIDKQITTMLEESVKKEVDWFVIAGDLFDKHIMSAYYFNKVVDSLRMFQVSGIKIVVIQGNHEAKEAEVPLTNAIGKLKDKLIYVYDKISLIQDAGIILIPHIRKDEYKRYKNYTEYVKEQVDQFEISKPIVIGHFQPTNSRPGSEQEMFSGSTRFIDCSIFKNALVICGHVHKPQEIGRVIIPGSPVRFSLAERQEVKRFVVYDTETQNLESIPLHCQKMALIKIDLFSKNTFSIPYEQLRKYRNALVFIKITASKKNRYKIGARDIISKFEEAGAKVMSYEVHTLKEKENKLKNSDTKNTLMTPNNIFARNVNKAVKKVEDRKRILSLGKKVLGEVND